jgi:SsrA-binding protein
MSAGLTGIPDPFSRSLYAAGKFGNRDTPLAKSKKDDKPDILVIATNRRAHHEYFIEERFEAGLELKGSEVKSIRDRQVSLDQGYCRLADGQLFIVSMNIAPYKQAGIFGHDPLRPRRLLLHAREINRISGRVGQSGYTVIPLRLYFRHGFAKLEIGVAKGKKLYDKRESIKAREAQRHIQREKGRARRMIER